MTATMMTTVMAAALLLLLLRHLLRLGLFLLLLPRLLP
jgi:hypothetical protein